MSRLVGRWIGGRQSLAAVLIVTWGYSGCSYALRSLPPWPLPFLPPPNSSLPGPKAPRHQRRQSPMPCSASSTGPGQRPVRRGCNAHGQTDRLSQGHRNLGQRLRDDHQLLQDPQNLCHQGRSQGRRPGDDDLYRHRRYRLPVPSSHSGCRPTENAAKGEIAVGTSPEGHALKFVHRGSYDGLDNTYEAITNYLDDHKLEAKDMFIEQYLTDPLTANEDHLVVNVYVLVK